MRLPDNVCKVLLALGLSALLAACGGGSGGYVIASTDELTAPAFGPEADYPQVLGEPFFVDGQLFTPEDVYSYDSVGYATLDQGGGEGVSVAHKTLPLPSYVEVTSLATGRTILARVERRGPMTLHHEVALSPGASAQLGIAEGEAVRVRRVNPPEAERAELRMGKTMPERLSTPESLLAVLKRTLPAGGGFASLAATALPADGAVLAQTAVAPSVASPQSPVMPSGSLRPLDAERRANASYPLAPLTDNLQPVPASRAAGAPAQVTMAAGPDVQSFSLPGAVSSSAAAPRSAAAASPPAAPDDKGGYVVQAAAFSSKANAQRLAAMLDGGFVSQSGSYYRVRCGPYPTRGQAEAALAKVRAAGYSDARVVSAG